MAALKSRQQKSRKSLINTNAKQLTARSLTTIAGTDNLNSCRMQIHTRRLLLRAVACLPVRLTAIRIHQKIANSICLTQSKPIF